MQTHPQLGNDRHRNRRGGTMKTLVTRTVLSIAILSLITTALPLFAQAPAPAPPPAQEKKDEKKSAEEETKAQVTEEIVVTSRKREEAVHDVPISWAAPTVQE